MLGAAAWPTGVPVQIHYTQHDPRRRQEWIDTLVASVRAASASAQVFDYPGSGHLFTDPSIPGEYDEQAAALLWHRALAFCRSPHDRPSAALRGSVEGKCSSLHAVDEGVDELVGELRRAGAGFGVGVGVGGGAGDCYGLVADECDQAVHEGPGQ